MYDVAVFVFIMLSLVVGYAVGRFQSRGAQATVGGSGADSSWSSEHYYRGLAFLLNDEPDAAIDTFIAALDVNSETLETHLALGSLLRKRGEVGRAIRVHQNLLARPSIEASQRHRVQMELAIDYLRSGLFDRAESLFNELLDAKGVSKEMLHKTTQYLLELYQLSGDWVLAIDMADRLTSRKFSGPADRWRVMQSHFACEMSEELAARGDWVTANQWVRTALKYDRKSGRANLLQAHYLEQAGDTVEALVVLRRAASFDSKVVPELLLPMRRCFQASDRESDYLSELKALYAQEASKYVLEALLVEMQKDSNVTEEVLHSLLADGVAQLSSLKFFGDFYLAIQSGSGLPFEKVFELYSLHVSNQSEYVCSACGFSGGQNHWLCPSCKRWATLARQ